MIVALGLPLKVATIILGCIFSMLLSDFNVLGPISMPKPPTVTLTKFFHADTVASIYPLPVSWYLISSLCMYLCSCMHIMFILCSKADAVSSGSWPILFKVLMLNVAWTMQFWKKKSSCMICTDLRICSSWISSKFNIYSAFYLFVQTKRKNSYSLHYVIKTKFT